jgi:hypothetical protein
MKDNAKEEGRENFAKESETVEVMIETKGPENSNGSEENNSNMTQAKMKEIGYNTPKSSNNYNILFTHSQGKKSFSTAQKRMTSNAR